ncbi:MAG: DHA2 family efflux MFS transporter permease subunit [Syntrophorhabdaceae bacterium]|nr:DHA2 family efflux MFS transporter permease subunit [Syntrophorhabdaceae bacterium]
MDLEGGRAKIAGGTAEVNKWLVAVTVMLPTLIEIIDSSVANVSLDHIRGSLSSGVDEAAWVLTSYLVSNAIIIPMTGWLSRVFGRKRYLIFSVVIFTVSSFMCGASTSLGMLVFFRVIQGLGGGAMQPMSQSILLETFPPEEHGMAMAIFGIGTLFGPIVGPLLGGYITDTLSWRWIFYVNIPIGLLAVFMISVFIYDPSYLRERRGEKADVWGLALLTIWVGALQIVVDKGQREDWFHSDFILILAAVAVLAFILFVIVELRFAKNPVVDLRVFRNLSFTGGNAVMFVAFFNLLGSIVLLPLYAQLLLGYTATLAGLVLSPGGIATIFTMLFAARFIGKHNPKYPLFFGILICALSTWKMSHLSLGADFSALVWSRVYLGLGMGLTFIPLTTLTLSSIPKPQMGNATGIYNLLRNLGGSIGVAFSTTMFARRAQVHQSRLVEHLTPFDSSFVEAVERGKALLQMRGIPEASSEKAILGRIYSEVVRQATMMGFNDAFLILSILMLSVMPLLFLLRRPAHQTRPAETTEFH